VVFVDLVGFTAESDEADPEDVHARLVPYHQRVRSEIESYGGTVEKLIGDGVMAVFGVPVAHEDDPERAVRAALRIQAGVDELNEEHEGLSLVVRIGINSGEAMVTTGGQGEKIVGDVVNTASRLESIAPSGGVVVGETTHRATELLIVYVDMESVEVKGKSKPLSVWRAVEPRGRYGIDAAFESVTPFLGRESEMTLLKETFKRVLEDGALQLVTVAAPPGVGKSRLINEFWHWADDQPEIVWWRQGRCLPYGEGITFWALGEIVKGQTGIRESDDAKTASEKLAIALEGAGPLRGKPFFWRPGTRPGG
jgi:class 3 adenylate cyclase